MVGKLSAYASAEPVKLIAHVVQGVIAVLAFVAIVFFDSDEKTVIAAAVAVIGLLEGQSRVTRAQVSPVTPAEVPQDEADPVGGPAGDPDDAPLEIPDEGLVPEED